MNRLELKTELSKEWNKPKEKNLLRNKEGKIIDKRKPRNYDKIQDIYKELNKQK